MEVVIPESRTAPISLKAQALLGYVEISKVNSKAVKDISASLSIGRVDVHEVDATGAITVHNELGHVRVREVKAASLMTKQTAGVLKLDRVEFTETADLTLRFGHARLGHVDAVSAVKLGSELAHVSAWFVDSPLVSMRVDYGSLSFLAPDNFVGRFSAVSPYGFLNVKHGAQVTPKYTTNNPATIEGSVTAPAASSDSDLPKAMPMVEIHQGTVMSLQSVYGSVDLFFPDPATAYERDHRAKKDRHH
jgi:hypothetical protein